MNDNYCNICRVSFKNARGLHCHNIRNIGHPQDELSSKSSSSTDKEQMNRKQKQSLVVIEKLSKKKTRYADIDKTNLAIEIEFDHDNNDTFSNEDEESNPEIEKIGWAETIDNILRQEQMINGNGNDDRIMHPHHPDLIPGPIEVYGKYQLDLYSQIYGLEAINSIDLQEFKNLLKSFEKKKLNIIKCYLFGKQNNISRNSGDDMLKLVKLLSPDITMKHIPKSWKTITRFIDEQTNFYICHKATIPFPKHWEMDKWNCNNAPCPEPVVIRIRDLLELIADQCVNPIIHLLWKDHVHINCYKKSNEEEKNVYCDIMTSEWAHATQKSIEEINPNGLLVPICFYGDDVTIGMNGKAHLTPIMFTLGFYDDKLRKKDVSRNVLGYLDKLSDISDEALITHFKEVKSFSRTKAIENIKYFKKQVFFKFWEMVLDSIKAAANRGILVKILGHGDPKLLFPRIAFHAGDDPAQHDIAAIKCGSNVMHNCIRCMYDSRDGKQYNPKRDSLRNMTIVDQIKKCAAIYQKHLAGVKCSIAEHNLLKDLQDKGHHPIINPFFDAPFGIDNHIFNTPTDIMHLFSCGLIKSVLLWTLAIIGEIRTHKVGISSFPYSNNSGLFDQRLQSFPAVPLVPHLHWCKFKDGLMYITENKSRVEKSYATGSGGGFRSSEYIPALIQTYFAVS